MPAGATLADALQQMRCIEKQGKMEQRHLAETTKNDCIFYESFTRASAGNRGKSAHLAAGFRQFGDCKKGSFGL